MAISVLAACTAAHAKSEKTYFTPERIALARANVDQFDWARNMRDRIIVRGDRIRYYIGPIYTAADTFAAQSDEFLWMLQPPATIPRTYDYGAFPRAECPLHGAKVKKNNAFNPWSIDPIGHPYQVRCPVGGEWYPSNRYDLGDMTTGPFAEDGSGFLYEGKRYHFLIEYAHMVYGSVVVPTLKSLSEAYCLTGDEKYAHKGCVLLARLATQYPNYGWEGTDYPDLEDRTATTYLGPYGGSHPFYKWKQGGLITDLIWETFMLERIAYAYDGLYDYFDNPKVLAFVKSKGMPVESGDDLRTYIENYILRSGMVALLREKVKGNEGHHQACAMALALVMDDYGDRRPNSRDMVEYTYHGVGRTAYIMDNGLTRDGGGHESPNYNTIKLDFIRAARVMEEVRRRHPEQVPSERYPDIFAAPKARQLFDHLIDSKICDYWLPPRRVEPQAYSQAGEENLFAFIKYGDPRFARAMSSRKTGELSAGDLWESYPVGALQEALQDPKSVIVRKSRLLDGYGVAILEAGDYPQNRAFVLNYSSTIGHRQMDQLSVGLYARGVEFLEDLGYPRTWNYRWQWDSNNMAHNTVTVNESRFSTPRFFQNMCRLFAVENGVHAVTASHSPYIQGHRLDSNANVPCDLYERTSVLVEVDDERFYVVDLFAVNGGEQHDQSWHAMYVPVQTPDLDWTVQDGGTLAGPDVPEFGAYTDRWGRRYEDGNFASFLTEIRRASLDRSATWRWDSGLDGGDGLAMHIVPVSGPVEIVMGKGRSPVWVGDKLDYLLVRRQVEAGAPTHYLTILEPFQVTPDIQSVNLVSTDPITVAIKRTNGTDRVAIRIPTGPSRTTQPRPVGIRVSVNRGDELLREVVVGDLGKPDSPGYARATILRANYDTREIVLADEGLPAAAAQPGRAIRIYNDMRSAMYMIEAAERRDGRLVITLDKPALLSRFRAVAAAGGRLELKEDGPFVTGHVNTETGELTDGPHDYYYGAWIGDGPTLRKIAGIANTTPPYLHFAEPVSDEVLVADYVGKVVPIWTYAAGDAVEIACIKSGSQTQPE
jgi:hypothetical protein